MFEYSLIFIKSMVPILFNVVLQTVGTTIQCQQNAWIVIYKYVVLVVFALMSSFKKRLKKGFTEFECFYKNISSK